MLDINYIQSYRHTAVGIKNHKVYNGLFGLKLFYIYMYFFYAFCNMYFIGCLGVYGLEHVFLFGARIHRQEPGLSTTRRSATLDDAWSESVFAQITFFTQTRKRVIWFSPKKILFIVNEKTFWYHCILFY